MSPNSNGNKRKPTDQNPENSPAPKHLKIDDNTMASVPPPRPLAQQEIAETIMAFPGWPVETKRKYISGIDNLQQVVENKGVNSPEGQTAQTKIDKILVHLRGQVAQRQQQQQQQLQMQQAAAAAAAAATMSGGVPSGAVSGVPGVGGISAPAIPGTNNAMGPSPPSRWIPPANLTPQAAEQWKADIGAKLTGLGQKLATAKAQVQEQNAALERGGHTPEAEAMIRKKLQEAHSNFTQCKEILGNFYRSQKQMQAQRQQHQGQPPQQSQLPGGAPVHSGSTGSSQQMRPMQQQQPQHPQQSGMAPSGTAHQQPQAQNIQGRAPQPPPQGVPMQQQPLPLTQIQQSQQPQQQAQQMTPQKSQGAPVQRVSTPVDQALAGSSAHASSHVTPNNQVRQQAAMSPNQSNLQLQNQQQQQGQTPQQQPTRVPQNMVPQQQQMQQQQVQGQAVGRSPAPTNAGTPIGGPNSPAPRPGSAQPQQVGRAQAATNPPVQGQPPQQPGQQPLPQQQRQLPSGQLPPAAQATAQRDNPHSHRMPIPANLPLPPPVAVSIPPGRPSLTGGANNPANSVLGTPAVIKQPAFEFDEGGMGLLSKRKLEELVKQIDPEEKLDPDVEEVSKQADTNPAYPLTPLATSRS